jgi:1-acyl-sn-glycerol-3-phosphate acyltransferase
MMVNIAYYTRIAITLLVLAVFSIIMMGFTIVTLGFFIRKNFVWILTPCGKLIMRVWGLRMEVVPAPPVPDRQTVFVFNHTSSIDVIALAALGLPNTRFFLSGFLRQNPMFAILGYLTGIFWTVRQEFPEKRAQIFHNAYETLKRTGQSVALSPEGVRVGPLFIEIPKDSNPGAGWKAQPGLVRIWVGEMIDTSDWRPDDASRTKEEVRQMYVAWQRRIEDRQGTPGGNA